jgi:hypothetical protein
LEDQPRIEAELHQVLMRRAELTAGLQLTQEQNNILATNLYYGKQTFSFFIFCLFSPTTRPRIG